MKYSSGPAYHFGAKCTSGSGVEEHFFEKLAQMLRIIIRASWWLKYGIKNRSTDMFALVGCFEVCESNSLRRYVEVL